MEIGEVFINKYEILALIGKGGMSSVYLARDIDTHMQWAIKEYRKNENKNMEGYQYSIRKEAKMISKLCHSGIPRIEKVLDTDNSLIIIMDYIEGKTLDRIVQELGPLSEELVIDLAGQIINIFCFIHSKNIIYRDIKPANIVMKSNNEVSFLDFGIVREYSPKKTGDTTCLGTRGYAAPEQYGGMGQCDFRTDVYGFGATLFYLLTGISPANNNFTTFAIRKIDPNFSLSLEYIILKCIQPYPINRYQNFHELEYDFKNISNLEKKLKRKNFFKGFFKYKREVNIPNKDGIYISKKADKKKRNNSSLSTIPPLQILNETTILSDNSNTVFTKPVSVMNNEKMYVFLSYCHQDSDLADIIYNKLITYKFINIRRYTTNVPYKSSFKEFMNTLGTHDKVIMIISDQYLKSRACMYEVGQLINSPNFQNKILFIICSDNDKKYYKMQKSESIEAKIYDPHERNKYVIFWEEQCKILEGDLKKIENVCAKIETMEIIRDINQIISHDIGLFMKYLADVNGISFDALHQHDFKEFLKELGIE